MPSVDKMARNSSDIVKIGVKHSNTPNYLMSMDKKASLKSVIEEICRHWKLQKPEDYGLVFETNKEYVSDKNKQLITNGTILVLNPSSKRLVRDLIGILNSNKDPEMQLNSYKSLHSLCSDYAIAQEFLNQNGLELFISNAGQDNITIQCLGQLVCTFYEIMKHEDLVQWEDPRISENFIGQMSTILAKEIAITRLAQSQQTCLAVMESLICTESKYEMTDKFLNIGQILKFLESDDIAGSTHQNALALFNALFKLGDRSKKMKMKQAMEERNTRRFIVESIIRKKPNEEMRHQLYVLQTLLLNLLEEKMMTSVDCHDQKALEKIKELRKIAFENRDNTGMQRKGYQEDYKKLGFKNEIDPTQDFQSTPPGSLALEMIYLFAVNRTPIYTKMVLENSCRRDSHECPFAQSSIKIVKLICEIIKIGTPPEDQGTFLPMFFGHENPLEEMFSLTIQHVNKTWRDMRATKEDFDKVMDVAREQISGALKTSPMTMEEYKKALKSYDKINEERKVENRTVEEREAKAMKHLRPIITPEILDLIQRERLQYLVKGTRFNKYKKDGGKYRDKYFFCRLSRNHKSFQYGDWDDENLSPPLDHVFDNKLPISELKEFLVGSQCPHAGRRNKEKFSENLAFSFIKENGESVDFVASNEKIFNYWSDGVNVLLRRPMTSPKASEDLENFLQMEIKIRILDLEGIDIPDSPPPIPPLPTSMPGMINTTS